MATPTTIWRRMKFWEILSAFCTREDVLLQVLEKECWRSPFLECFTNRNELVDKQDRKVLDSLVPAELSREIAASFDGRFLFDPESRIFRADEEHARKHASPDAIEMSALDVHDRFGGAFIEEVYEKGSVRLPSIG